MIRPNTLKYIQETVLMKQGFWVANLFVLDKLEATVNKARMNACYREIKYRKQGNQLLSIAKKNSIIDRGRRICPLTIK